MSFFIEPEIVDAGRRRAAVARLREAKVTLPTWSELADPAAIASDTSPDLSHVDPDAPEAANLWRVHWFNDAEPQRPRGRARARRAAPGIDRHEAPIVVLFGRRFPMIGAHKVLAAYACLVPRLVTGQFDPSHDRAVWPSTGNYCRGGVAISRILGCRGVAVLPAGMSRERFEWLQQWVAIPPTSSARPAPRATSRRFTTNARSWRAIAENIILNQFSEFANYLIHYHCTGRAFDLRVRPSPARTS